MLSGLFWRLYPPCYRLALYCNPLLNIIVFHAKIVRYNLPSIACRVLLVFVYKEYPSYAIITARGLYSNSNLFFRLNSLFIYADFNHPLIGAFSEYAFCMAVRACWLKISRARTKGKRKNNRRREHQAY